MVLGVRGKRGAEKGNRDARAALDAAPTFAPDGCGAVQISVQHRRPAITQEDEDRASCRMRGWEASGAYQCHSARGIRDRKCSSPLLMMHMSGPNLGNPQPDQWEE